MKTSDMKDAALDWAVATANGDTFTLAHEDWDWYSSSWEYGGPIIEREGIAVWPDDEEGGWFASSDGGRGEDYKGTTPLIAAMRCFVASTLGGEVEIPEELT